MLLLAFLLGGVNYGYADTTYKLTQVTSVEADGLYVFEQKGYVMNNTVNSKALQTTNTYSSIGLTGTETYVWKLEAAQNGFYMNNISINQYLNGASGKTDVSFGSKSDIWAFNFQDNGTVNIQNTSNSNRFLGFTSTTTYVYKAYSTANNNLTSGTYPHAIKVYKLEEENSSLTACDLTLTNAPVALTFDLYNNSAAQVISYTTSSSGAVSVSESDYATFSVDQTNKTITVTPTAVTPSAQTITVTQAADETYDAGSATFTFTVSDTTPFAGGDVTFDATSDKGTNSSGAGSIVKDVVTMAGTSCNLSDGVAYRLYSGSTTTFSTTQGNITKIEFTMASGYASTLLSANGYSEGTWTGNAQSVSFTASAQARVTKIVVTVNTKKPVATIKGITPTSIDLNDEGNFTCDIEYAEGVTATDATITWSSDDENVLVVDETDGSYLTGESGGTVSVTVTVTPNDETSYSAVSEHFTVTVVDPNGPGSQNNPYTVAQVINGDADGKTDIWVKGYIVGSWNNNNFDPENLVDSNLALADDYNSTTTIPVELSNTSGLRTTWGPASNPKNINVAQVVLKGNGTKYFNKNAVKGTSEIEKVAEMVTVTSAEYATRHSDVALDYSAGGIKAYTATDNGTSVKLNEITSGQVPANTPVVLYKAGGCTVNVPVIEEAAAVGSNDLRVSEGQAYSNAFVLAQVNGTVGFYLWDDNETLNEGKVYLLSASGARQFLPFEETTAINNMNAETTINDIYFDLQGRRVMKAQKGLYIVNGKKVVK